MQLVIVWYVFGTAIGIWFASAYNGWINRQAEANPLPASILTMFGVAGIEIIRVIRAAPLICYLVSTLDSTNDPSTVMLLYAGGYALDALAAYIPTGLIMMSGNLKREATSKLVKRLEDIGDADEA